MNQTPISPYQETEGLCYFPRMINKIRLMEKGELREDFHDFMGKGLDARMCDFLRISYDALKAKAISNDSDSALLAWSFETGRELNEGDKLVWNHFLTKLGWEDHVSESVKRRKAESGLEARDDIVTMAQYMEVDEGRAN